MFAYVRLCSLNGKKMFEAPDGERSSILQNALQAETGTRVTRPSEYQRQGEARKKEEGRMQNEVEKMKRTLLKSETGVSTAKPSRLAAPPNFSQFVNGKPATAQRGFAQMDFVARDFQIGSEPDRASHGLHLTVVPGHRGFGQDQGDHVAAGVETAQTEQDRTDRDFSVLDAAAIAFDKLPARQQESGPARFDQRGEAIRQALKKDAGCIPQRNGGPRFGAAESDSARVRRQNSANHERAAA